MLRGAGNVLFTGMGVTERRARERITIQFGKQMEIMAGILAGRCIRAA
jgi:hypothetical protein